MSKKVLVFSPHPDDETLGCGGTIMKRISEGYEAVVVEMTDGRYAFLNLFGIDSDPTPEELKQIRREEVERATGILGLRKENLLFLDFEDGSLEDHEKETAKKVTKIIGDFSPSEIYFPYEKDVNSDHKTASRIIQACLARTGFLPTKFRYSITHRYDRIGPVLMTLLNAHLHVDISDFLDRKKAAIKEFRSQVTIFSSRQEKPVMVNVERFQKGKETFLV